MLFNQDRLLSECRAPVAKDSPTCSGMGLQAAALSLVNSDMVDIQVCLGINYALVYNSFAILGSAQGALISNTLLKFPEICCI